MTPEPPATYRQAYVDPERARLTRTLLDYAFAHGLMLVGTGSGALSTVMTEREIDTLAEVLLGGFRTLKRMWGPAAEPAHTRNSPARDARFRRSRLLRQQRLHLADDRLDAGDEGHVLAPRLRWR